MAPKKLLFLFLACQEQFRFHLCFPWPLLALNGKKMGGRGRATSKKKVGNYLPLLENSTSFLAEIARKWQNNCFLASKDQNGVGWGWQIEQLDFTINNGRRREDFAAYRALPQTAKWGKTSQAPSTLFLAANKYWNPWSSRLRTHISRKVLLINSRPNKNPPFYRDKSRRRKPLFQPTVYCRDQIRTFLTFMEQHRNTCRFPYVFSFFPSSIRLFLSHTV